MFKTPLYPLLFMSLCIAACDDSGPATASSVADADPFVPPPLADRFIGGSLTDIGVRNQANSPCEVNMCPDGTRCEDDGVSITCIPLTCSDLDCRDFEICEEDESGALCRDLRCTTDLDCADDQYCNEQCRPDTCLPGSSRCIDNRVVRCADNGSDEVEEYICGLEQHGFLSECRVFSDGLAGCTCGDDWDCPQFMRCSAGRCLGQPVAPSCSLPPAPIEDALPTPEIIWGGGPSDPIAADRPFGASSQVVVTPLVGNLDDDNGDGQITEQDIPELIFLSFCDSNFTNNGALRIVHGGGRLKGMDVVSVLGDQRWEIGDVLPGPGDYRCQDGILDPTAPMAFGDLDPVDSTDGRPEIIANHENGGLVLFDHMGHQLDIAFNGELNQGPNPAPMIVNLDGQGFSEIVIGRTVITVFRDPMGQLRFGDRFEGNGARGRNPSQGALGCVADLLGTGQPQIIAGSSVYRWPTPPQGAQSRSDCSMNGGAIEPTNDDENAFCGGRLVVEWRGNQVNDDQAANEGYCAIADIYGVDQDQPPGPDNPLDGLPELVLVSNGRIQIFNGQTGRLISSHSMNLGGSGGAPNVDDFDGDGFPEVGSAFESGYAMLDLQSNSPSCATWPDLLDDNEQADEPRDHGANSCADNADCRAPDTVCNHASGQCVCLHNGWKRRTEDDSSRVTGSTLFDFNGDGAAEVIYNDECWFRIYDGLSGAVLLKEPSESRTRVEYPVVADVDNDGNAEIVFSTSTESEFCSERNDNSGDPDRPRWRDQYNSGIEVWGDPNDRWVSARRIWNQHSYHVTNVYESGRIPVVAPESWQVLNGRSYNTYRSQPRSRGIAPDLVVTDLQVNAPGDGCSALSSIAQIDLLVANQGDLRVGPEVLVEIDGTWAGQRRSLLNADGAPLTEPIGRPLAPGQVTRVTLVYDADGDPNEPPGLPDQITARVDAGGHPEFGQERECREDNNETIVDVIPPSALPDLVVLRVDSMPAACPRSFFNVVVANRGAIDAAPFTLRAYAGNPEQGGTLLDEARAIDGLAANGEAEFRMGSDTVPFGGSVGLYIILDQENELEECRDGNNLFSAGQLRCVLP
ncbi:MAG: hypothetical protein CMH52_06065 [Myxococcales bacterium]|nr:hypothetical protein [Myxococcales bacterium]